MILKIKYLNIYYIKLTIYLLILLKNVTTFFPSTKSNINKNDFNANFYTSKYFILK